MWLLDKEPPGKQQRVELEKLATGNLATGTPQSTLNQSAFLANLVAALNQQQQQHNQNSNMP